MAPSRLYKDVLNAFAAEIIGSAFGQGQGRIIPSADGAGCLIVSERVSEILSLARRLPSISYSH